MLFGTVLVAQLGRNPFEINPFPVDEPSPGEGETLQTLVIDKYENPFEIRPLDAEESPMVERKSAKPVDKIASGQRFLFAIIVFMLLLLTVLMTSYRNVLNRSYSAILSDNVLNQLFRERQGGSGAGFLPLYLMYIINTGIFIYLLAMLYGFNKGSHQFVTLLYCILGYGLLVLLRHLVLFLIGTIFPVSKETTLYNFNIIIFGIILGVLLVPVNVFIAFGPVEAVPVLTTVVLVLLGIAYLFRSLRGLLIANKLIVFYKFHFLLYICTVEIAPILIITKLLFGDFF